MITVATIRKIALALPGVVEKKGAPLEFRIGRKVLARVDIVAKTVKIAGVRQAIGFGRVYKAQIEKLLEQAWNANAPRDVVAARTTQQRRQRLNADTIRRVALALPNTRESSHFGGIPDFRVDGKIFATLDKEGTSTVLMWLSAERMEQLCRSRPRTYRVVGAGLRVFFETAKVAELEPLLHEAYEATRTRP
jgi:hypothetical protein